MTRARRRWLAFAAVAVLAWLASGVCASWWLSARPHAPHAEPLPAAWRGSAEELQLHSSDGETIGAWWLPPLRDDALAVVLVHGRGGERSSRLAQADVLRRLGAGVLMISLRAHGDSTGDREDFGWSARRDVAAAVAWLRARRPAHKVVLVGASMGAAACLFAVSEEHAVVDGLVLECPYRDLATAALRHCRLYLPPVMAEIAWAALRCTAAWRLPDFAATSCERALAQVAATLPVLVLGAGADAQVARVDLEALLAARPAHTQLTWIEGAAHDRMLATDPAGYERALAAFLGAVAAAR